MWRLPIILAAIVGLLMSVSHEVSRGDDAAALAKLIDQHVEARLKIEGLNRAAAGGGIRGGQVIGPTDREAAEVVERPISVSDFLATVCTILGIDYTRENHASGIKRPIPIVDTSKQVTVISELL